MESKLPISARKQLRFDGFNIDRVLIHAGTFPVQPGNNVRIVATLGGGWDMRTQQGDVVHYDQGEVCVLPPTLKRHTWFRNDGDNLLISVGDAFLHKLAEESGGGDIRGALAFQTLRDPFVHQLTSALAHELGPRGSAGPIYAESLVLSLLGYLLRGGSHPGRDEAHVPGGLSRMRLQACEDYIAAHLGGPLRVGDLARAVDMSTFHFTRAFKRSTGKTPHQYILERRVTQAESLLLTTEKPLNEISAQLGFSSPSHFSSVFAAKHGITPSAHRRRATPSS